MSIYQWLCLFGVPSIISLITGWIIRKPLASAEKRAKAAEEQAEMARQKSDAIALGVQALLRDRLLQAYRHYIDEKGWADYTDRGNVENMYAQYHALGANGVMDDMRRQFRQLPTRDGGPATPIDSD